MALTNLQAFVMIPNLSLCPSSPSNLLMDATGERYADVRVMGNAGNVRNVWIYLATVTEEDTLHISLQGVDSSGLPDGVILGSGNAGYVAATFLDSDDNKWVGPFQLGADVPVVAGQTISVVVKWNSYADGNLNISRTLLTHGSWYNQYTLTDNTASPGTWAKDMGAQLNVALEYSDGTYAVGAYGAGYQSTVAVNTGTNPDEVGNYFSLPVPVSVTGAWIYGDIDQDGTISLLDGGNNVLANYVISSAARLGTTGGQHYILFDDNPATSVALSADTFYRLTYTPSGSTSATIRTFSVPEAAAMGCFDLGEDCIYTYRTDGGSWSQTDTKRCQMGLICSQFDNGVSAGGGMLRTPTMTGGF